MNDKQKAVDTPQDKILEWIIPRLREWQEYRDQNFKEDWEKYYLMWRCKYDPKLRTRLKERSKLVSPALMEAIDDATSEIEAAVFGTGHFMDLVDDYMDKNKEDIVRLRNLLREDMDNEDVDMALREIILMMVIYGTGIGKLVVTEKTEYSLDTENGIPIPEQKSRYVVRVVPVHPMEFVIDPVARSINDALGCAHITAVPKHQVLSKMASGVYSTVDIGAYNESWEYVELGNQLNETKDLANEDKTLIIEYHGLIPYELYEQWLNRNEQEQNIEDLLSKEENDNEIEGPVEQKIASEMVEVIITIANGNHILRIDRNPMLMGDRAFIAAQYERIPNRFWGRGIGEKGINVARAIDAEMRGRIDAMALNIAPPIGVNAGAIPPGQPKPEVAAGNVYLFNGPPDQAMRPLNMGGVGPETFNQTNELRLMMQQATGTIDFARSGGFQNEKAGVVQAAQSPASKKASRVIANVEKYIIAPMVHKVAWRYIQFDPERYPAVDVKFNVKTHSSAMAQELQQQQYASLLSSVPADSPAYYLLLKGIFENSALPDRENILAAIEQMIQMKMQQEQKQQMDPVLQLQVEELKHKERMDEEKLKLEQAKIQQTYTLEQEKLELERDKIVLNSQLKAADIEQNAFTSQLQAQAQFEAANKDVPNMQNIPMTEVENMIARMMREQIKEAGGVENE